MSLELRLRAGILVDRARSFVSVPTTCFHENAPGSRDSPHEVLPFDVGPHRALICYGRPSARGRTVFGDLVPWGALWRTGADEPTTIYLPFAARIAGIGVPRGLYSIYTVPHESSWTIVVNRSIRQSGRTREEVGKKGNHFPDAYTSAVRRAEVGRAEVESGPCAPRERLTITPSPATEVATNLLIEWGSVRATVPVEVRR
jgi:Protein of unknown function (DUF2911)